LHAHNEGEQHRLLSMIERMSREGRSEQEIVAALGESGARTPAPSRKRPVRGRLARWAAGNRA